jgi:hypothetical protein
VSSAIFAARKARNGGSGVDFLGDGALLNGKSDGFKMPADAQYTNIVGLVFNLDRHGDPHLVRAAIFLVAGIGLVAFVVFHLLRFANGRTIGQLLPGSPVEAR